MKENLIKFWSQKLFWFIAIINLIIMIVYTIIAGVLISTTTEKLINIFVPWIINIIILAIIYLFTINNIGSIYQLKTSNANQPQIWKMLLIIFGFIWLIFFVGNAFYMFGNAIGYQTKLDYFATLTKNWWKPLIISLYSACLLIVHRQLLWRTINKQMLPWEGLQKKIKNGQKIKKDFNEN